MGILRDEAVLIGNLSATQVPRALSRIDTEGIIFFLGVLLSIACLDNAGILKDLALLLDQNLPSKELIATVIGLASAVVDNVPLVAATMGMYDVATVPQDSVLWQLIAYCAGTGGSILIIGSAAGVAYMGMESAEFTWYLRRVSPWALAGYVAGIGTYLGQSALLSSPQVIAALPDFVHRIGM
jgi:Na+/H+ antiporter NhaD/arsenite permease-like protein